MNAFEPRDLAELALELSQEPDVEQTLERLVEYARDALACDDAGVMLLHSDKRIESAAMTHSRVAESDRLQTTLGEGPCLNALRTDTSFLVEDTSTDDRWPRWGRAVAELGMHSAIGVRLSTSKSMLGALNLYSNRPGHFDDDDLEVADIFGRHASIALANAREEQNLHRAIGTRQIIGQAQGILMERYGLDPDRAFHLLRRYSQRDNVKLRDVAQQVLDTRSLPQ